MQRKWLLVLICGLAFQLQAQEKISVGLKAGIGLPNLKASGSNTFISGFSSVATPNYGITGNIEASKKWSFQIDIHYNHIRVKKDGDQTIPKSILVSTLPPNIVVPNNLYANFLSNIDLKYLEIPMMVKYNVFVGEQFDWFVNAGFFTGLLLNATITTSGFGAVYTNPERTNLLLPFQISLDQNREFTDQLQPLNIGLQGGLGVNYKGTIGNIFLQVNGNSSLFNVQKNSSDGQNKTQSLNIMLGYQVHLYKK
ncbi:MAG: outer membrane beta-barrel protein [Chitinophagaceae bacterium]